LTQILWKTALVSDADAKGMAHAAGVPMKVARWLCARGIPENDARQWLHPETATYSQPTDFAEAGKAVDILLQALERQEKIAVVGDYDVDGVTASVILVMALRLLQAHWCCDIPHRVDDGYGLSETIVERLHRQGVKVIVTVDNGIRTQEAIDLAVACGMQVVVTDHHEPDLEAPLAADAVVHWSRAGNGAKLNHLSGAGVAWKLSQTLLETAEKSGYLDTVDSLQRAEEAQYSLGLAALGALADLMPMTLENRKLVREGLAALADCRRPGWVALCETAHLSMDGLSSTALLWRITPRLNAAGRMDSADVAFQLLLTNNSVEAHSLAQRVEELNSRRRAVTEEAAAQAEVQCRLLLARYPGGLVAVGPWPRGVVGIVAARLVDLYQRPILVFSEENQEILYASGRAPEGISLIAVLERCSHLLHHFGGHEAAVGCAVERGMLEELRQAFSAACCQVASTEGQRSGSCAAAAEPEGRSPVETTAPFTGQKLDGVKQPAIADDFLALADVTMETVAWVEAFAPFSSDFPPLSFYLGPVELEAVKPVGTSGHHLRLTVVEAGTRAQLVWFKAPAVVDTWRSGQQMSAVVELEANHWRGQVQPQLRVLTAQILPGALGRKEFGEVYRLLRAHRKLQQREAYELLPAVGESNLETVLKVFVELGFAQCRESAYHVVESVEPRDLRESVSYHNYLYRAALNPQQTQ